MIKRARKKVKRKPPKRPRALSAAEIEQRLLAAFPELDEWTIRNNRAALLPYLKRDGDTNEKDYDKPGEFGKYFDAHVAYVWLREKDDKSY
jgi:hypothetical protein